MGSWAHLGHLDERGDSGRKEGRRGWVAGSPSWEILVVERARADVAPAGKPRDQSWKVASRIMMYLVVESWRCCRQESAFPWIGRHRLDKPADLFL